MDKFNDINRLMRFAIREASRYDRMLPNYERRKNDIIEELQEEYDDYDRSRREALVILKEEIDDELQLIFDKKFYNSDREETVAVVIREGEIKKKDGTVRHIYRVVINDR